METVRKRYPTMVVRLRRPVPTTPFYDNPEGCLTGLYGRKWLNPDPAFVAGDRKSAQPFVLMRYAEVLLNAAEAGVELAIAGEPLTPDGSDMMREPPRR